MSETLTHLLERVSVPANLLAAPAPSAQELEQIIQAAVCAPDHGALRPWRFLSITGESRNQLGELFCQASLQQNPDLTPKELDAIRQKPMRSPLIVAVIAAIQEHPKISATEQRDSAAAAAQNILLAANAIGYGSIWLTGPFASNAHVQQQLGLSAGESIVAFIYLGTPNAAGKMLSQKKLCMRPKASNFLSSWHHK